MRLWKTLGFAILASALLMPTKAKADVIFAMDMDTATAGIQNSRSVSVGTTFDVALVMLLDGGSEVSYYSLGIAFDQAELQVQNATRPLPTNWTRIFNNFGVDNGAGTIWAFHATTFFDEDVITAPSTTIGVLTINATAPTTDGFADLTPSYLNLELQDVDGVLDRFGGVVDLGVTAGDGGVFFQAGSIDIANVPEPSSAFALVALLGGVVGVRRFRKKRQLPKE